MEVNVELYCAIQLKLYPTLNHAMIYIQRILFVEK